MPEIRPYTAGDLERLRSVQTLGQGWTHATHDQRREFRHPDTGERIKVVTDQLGNRIRMRRDGQDVRIMAPHITVRLRQEVTP